MIVPVPGEATLGAALPLVFGDDFRKLAAALESLPNNESLVLLRLAMAQPGRRLAWYQSLYNRWEGLGRPPLKPNPVSCRVLLVASFTAEPLLPLVSCFAAALGVHLEIATTGYDSVEPVAFKSQPSQAADFYVVALDDAWLMRRLGGFAAVAASDVDAVAGHVRSIVEALPGRVLLTSFAPPSFPLPAGYANGEGRIGLSAARAALNSVVFALQSERVAVVDSEVAVHGAGGEGALSTANYARAKIPYSAAGMVGLAREIAVTLAAASGKSHRAVVTDLDNTLWGGVVGELGTHGISTGPGEPEGLAYYQLQQYLGGLRSLGALLAIASKNDPSAVEALRDNPELALQIDDFAAVEIHWQPKSCSMAEISKVLGFGSEFFLFLDDSLFELAEVLSEHPFLDVVHAAEDPLETRARLAALRPCATTQLTEADLLRREHLAAKRAATELEASYADYGEYLRAIDIEVEVAPLQDTNRSRVLQLLAKCNQFNLTTRRHGEAELAELEEQGAQVGVFSYRDSFGFQGIIAAAILVPDDRALRIDSWVMSCRVLNRSVEELVLQWMISRAGERALIGEYRPSDKNVLVRDLYPRLGFHPTGEHRWQFEPGRDSSPESKARLVVAD